MLPSQYRLRKMKDFDILYKEGRFVGGKYVTAKVWRIDPEAFPRRSYSKDDLKIGIVVGKKVHKSAVKRNRIKRQIREIIRLLLKDKRLKAGSHLALMATPAAFGASYADLEISVLDVLKKSGLLL